MSGGKKDVRETKKRKDLYENLSGKKERERERERERESKFRFKR